MNRTVVITGASSGFGRELAASYRALGDTVYSLSRTNPDHAPYFLQTDVSDPQQVQAALFRVGSERGKIDVLINNAGVGISGAAELLPCERVRSVMDINFTGAFYCAKYALPYMRRGSRIINVSSACALFALPFRTIYCAAKSALQMLSYGLRMELSGTGIQVTAVCPGDTKTGFTANRIKEYATNSRYGSRVRRAAETVDRREEKRMPCKRVTAKIFRICQKKRLAAFYIVGAKYKVLYALSRILPVSVFLRLTGAFFGGNGEE